MVVDTEAAETVEIIAAVVEEVTATTAKMKMASSLRLEKNPETLAATIITAVIEETVVTAVVIVAVAAVIVAIVVTVEVAAVVVVPTQPGMMAVMPKTNQPQLKLLDKDRNEEKNLNKTENAKVISKRQQLEFVKVSAMEMQIKELFVSYLKMID